MNKEYWISGITAFLIAAGGALGVVLVGDADPTWWQVLAAVVLGIVSGAKDVRALMKLPPIVPLLLVVGLLAFTPGCALFKAEPAQVAVNISDASRITVEAALRAWNVYIPVGKPSISQQVQVRDAWQKYKAAQLLILDAAVIIKEAENAGLDSSESQAALNRAIAEATTALADLIGLVREFGVKL